MHTPRARLMVTGYKQENFCKGQTAFVMPIDCPQQAE